MKISSILLVALLGQAQPIEFPSIDGAYWKSPSGWTKLEIATASGGGTKHMAKMLVPGLTPQIVWTFRQAEAPVQIEEARPTFYVKRPANFPEIAGQTPRDFVIVRFDKKKDRRELQASSGGSAFTFKAGLSKDRLPDVFVETVASGIFSITAKEPLTPGEYLITYGMGNSGYDFGIKAKPKPR